MGNRTVEVRVHGIGNHDPLSALGTPIDADGKRIRDDDKTTVVRENGKIERETWFVAWTRTARKFTRAFWYVAVPFTLANTAGFMRPHSKWARPVHAALVLTFGALLTLGGFLWSVSIAETVRMKLDRNLSLPASIPLWSMTLAWIVVIGSRVWRNRGDANDRPTDEAEIQTPGFLSLFHVLLIASAAAAIYLLKPGIKASVIDAPCLLGTAGPGCLVLRDDWTVLIAAVTVGIFSGSALLIALIAALIGQTIGGEKAGPWLGTALIFFLASMSLHLGGAIVNLVFDWFFVYIDGFAPFWRPPAPSGGGFPTPGGGPVYDALLRSYDDPAMPFHGRDSFISFVTPLLAALAIFMLLLRLTDWMSSADVKNDRRTRRAKFAHRVICEWSALKLGFALLGLLALCGFFWWQILRVQLDVHNAFASVPGRSEWLSSGWNRAKQPLIVAGTHLILVLFVLGWFSKNIRATIAVLGDVIGYWPVRYHPAAASPYRFAVLNAARSQILALRADKVVVIGHSQGSVLAGDLVRGDLTRGGQCSVGLITCGSPLGSLYARYFPTEFSGERLQAIARHSSLWTNFWRETDPIATELGLAAVAGKDVGPLPDGGPGDDLKGHSDYWAEPSLRNAVDSWCMGAPTSPGSEQRIRIEPGGASAATRADDTAGA